MSFLKHPILLSLGLFSFSPLSQAAWLSTANQALILGYDTEQLYNIGIPELSDNRIIFTPNLTVSAPANQFSYFDIQSFSASIELKAKPGYRIDGYTLTAIGDSYVGDDAIVGIHGNFNTTFYGASYYSGFLSGVGPWSTNGNSSTSLPTLSFAGDISVETQNHYSYENLVGYSEIPIYELRYIEVLIGFEPILDEQGNQIGETPIYESRYEEVLSGYVYEPYYETIFQTSGGSFQLNSVQIDVQVSSIPLPPTVWLFWSGLTLLGWTSRKRLSLN